MPLIKNPQSQSALSAIDKACAFVKKLVDSGHYLGSAHLPTLAILAAQANFSRPTMWKAIKKLSGEGIVSVKQGGYIRAGSTSPMPSFNEHLHIPRGKWQKLAAAIEQDLVESRFGHEGILPSIGELQALYGVNNRTLRKSLQYLQNERILLPFGKSYRRSQHVGKSAKTIVLISGPAIGDITTPQGQRTHLFVHSLEQECARSGINLAFIPASLVDTTMTLEVRTRLKQAGPVEGFILRLWWLDIEEIYNRYRDLLEYLSRLGKPIVVLDEIGTMRLPFNSPSMRIFRIAARAAGKDAGRTMRNLGFTSAGYVSVMHWQAWSQQRLLGLQDSFIKNGNQNAISSYVNTEGIADYYETVFGLTNIPEHLLTTVFYPELSKIEMRDFLSRYRAVRQKRSESLVDESVLHRLKANLMEAARIKRRNLRNPFALEVQNSAIKVAWAEIFSAYLKPLLDQLLSAGNIRLCIGANDVVALAAKKYFSDKKIRVPEDMSVIGFDNTADAHVERLSSYDFAMDTMAKQILDFLINPDRFNLRESRRIIEQPGTVILRESVETKEAYSH